MLAACVEGSLQKSGGRSRQRDLGGRTSHLPLADDDDDNDDDDNDDDDDDDIETRRVLIELLAAYIGRFINVSSEFRLSVFLRFLHFKISYI